MIWQIIFSASGLASIFFLSFNLKIGGVELGSNLNALMIVLGGTVCATLMTYHRKKLIRTFQILKKSFGPREKNEGLVQAIARLARNYRGGWDIRHLEQQIKDLPPGLLKTGVGLIAYQYDRNKIEQTLRQEASCIRGQYESASKILHDISQIAPSLGLIGTIVNFIRFFGQTHDIHGLATCTALAFLSTFYGVLLAKLGLVPLANKLKEFMAEETFRLDLIQEGILNIWDQEHPRAIQFKLESRLAAREAWDHVVPSPEVVLLPPEQMALEGKRVGPALLN